MGGNDPFILYKKNSNKIDSKTMTVKREAKDIGITVEMRKFNKYEQVTARLTSLGTLVPNRIELDLSHRLTFGTSASYTDRNGNSVDISLGQGSSQQLFDTNHGLRGS